MSRLFISCISDSATERDLYGLFAGFGRLASFDLKKGFGFVHYAHTADADKARRALDKYPFFGRALKVERGRNQDASPPRGGDENGHTILCFRCKREGHRARDCLVLKQNARRRTRSRSRERGADRARPRDRRSPSPPRQRRSPEPRRGPRDDRHEEREEGEMIEATSSDARPQPADSAEPARDRTATATTVDPLAHVDDDEDGERDFRRAFEDTDGSDAEQREKEDRHWRRASDNNTTNDSRARKAVTEESDARRRPADRRSRERERTQRDGSGREPATRGDRDTRAAEPARPRERERERERETEERERERRRREAERERERARERDRRQRELEEMRRREGSANGATRRVAAPDRPPLPSSRTTERERERERGLKRKERSPSPVRDREPRGSSRHAREEEQQPQKHRRTSSNDNGQQQKQQQQQPSEGPLSPVEELLAVPSSPVAHSPVRDAVDEPRGTRRDRERDRDRDDRRARP